MESANPNARRTSPIADADLQRLLERVRDYAIVALDAEGRILSWSAGAQRMTGFAPDDILGRHFSIFYPPEDIARGKPDRDLKLAAGPKGRSEDDGWRVRKDGSRFFANTVITVVRDDSEALQGFVCITRDTTARRADEEALRTSEERFRLIVQKLQDYAVFMLDPKGQVVTWNDGAESLTGYAADEIIGHPFSALYPAEDVAAGKPTGELRAVASEGRRLEEGWRVRKDGSLFWADDVTTSLRNEKGKLLGFAKVMRDLSERRAAQERSVAEARRAALAEFSGRAKAEFLTAMSHELRTPLNAIGGYAELIEMGVGGPVTEQQQEYLERIRSSQQHLLAIISDLLNYSRIESGQITYELAPVPLQAVVTTVLDLVAQQAKRKGIQLLRGHCGRASAMADRHKVEQIVLNLLSNAVKFTPEGGRVIASCGATDSDTFIAVEDTGPGVPTENRETIFEPFVQLGRSLTSAHHGIGLGLAISRDMARAMDGDVLVGSTPEHGSVFTLTLPKA